MTRRSRIPIQVRLSCDHVDVRHEFGLLGPHRRRRGIGCTACNLNQQPVGRARRLARHSGNGSRLSNSKGLAMRPSGAYLAVCETSVFCEFTGFLPDKTDDGSGPARGARQGPRI